MNHVPVLEVGGTHVSAALVDPQSWQVTAHTRVPLDADASADQVLDTFVAAGDAISAEAGACWGVAMPDPFDYAGGVGQFEGVGKFAALNGVDVRTALLRGLSAEAAGVRFINDADAFILGEWVAGAAQGADRCVGITLGTGIGSGWLADGLVADPGDPAGGRAHRLRIGGSPLEDVVSRRAIRRAFHRAGGDRTADVRQIAEFARRGDERAGRVLDESFAALGEVLAPRLAAFHAEIVVIGGSMAASWDLFEPSFRAGARVPLPAITLAGHPDTAALAGAAVHATRG